MPKTAKSILPLMPFGQSQAQVFRHVRDFADAVSSRVDNQFDFDAIGDAPSFHHAVASVNINGTHLLASVSTPTHYRVGESDQLYLMLPFHGVASAVVKGHRAPFDNVRDAFLSPNTPRSGEGSTLAMIQAMLDPERLTNTARTMLGNEAARKLQPFLTRPNVLAFQQGHIRYDQLFKRMGQTIDDLQLDESLLTMHGIDDSLYRTLVMMMLPEFCLGDGSNRSRKGKAPIDRVCEYIQVHLAQAITLTQLEEFSGMTSRRLRYGFQKRFGCSPMQWVAQQRLELAHQKLIRATPTDTVTSVALEYGITRLGPFAQDYYRRFGERPSETLARALQI